MKPAEYLEAINAATTAGELGELLALAKGDPDLNRASEARLQSAVLARFEAIKVRPAKMVNRREVFAAFGVPNRKSPIANRQSQGGSQ